MNKVDNGISLRDGHMFLDGVEVNDCLECSIIVTPEVFTGRVVGQKGKSSRWRGLDIKVTVTRRRSTPWLRIAIKNYLATGVAPKFVIQGINSDPNSDYFKEFGNETVTVTGCIPTGDIKLIALAAEGDMLDDALTFVGGELV